MGEIKAIETEYRGYRMRSRLEARWAVFFDALGIEWRYEAEGYELPSGRYLPDFVLPAGTAISTNLFVEVKGVFSHRDFLKVVGAALDLPRPSRPTLHPQILILGDVPDPDEEWAYAHQRLDVVDDVVVFHNVYFRPWAYGGLRFVAEPTGEGAAYRRPDFEQMTAAMTETVRANLTRETVVPRLIADGAVAEAYRAARSARFEHGESGWTR